MIKAATTMTAARMERSESGQQFFIPRPKENSWGNKRVVDNKRIIQEFVRFTPVMNQREDEKCMSVAPPFYARRPLEVSVLSLLRSPWISSSS